MIKRKKALTINNLIFLSLVIKIIFAFIFGDSFLDNEWGIILHNFEISGTFGFNVVNNEFSATPKFAEAGEIVLPTVFMPPLYFYYIYLLKILTNNFLNIVYLVIFSQIILSTVSIYIFHKILKNFGQDEVSALFLTAIFALFPINIYASLQISSVTLQLFLSILFFFFLITYSRKQEIKYLLFFSIISGLLILIRGEFLIFYFFTVFYFFVFFKKNLTKLCLSLFITILVISPYLNRNYQQFDTLVLTKSFGYNLLKGNNPSKIIEGNADFINKEFNKQELKIKTDKRYEIKLDNFYKDKAIEYILQDPVAYVKLYFLKIFSFLFIDMKSTYPDYYNIFHIIPKIFLSISSLIGGIMVINKKGFFQYLSIYYFLNILLFSIFFILPRYSLIFLPVQLLLSLEFLRYLKRKLFN